MRILILATTFTFLAVNLFATTIVPFKDLGQLSYAADAIVLATAEDIAIIQDDYNKSYYQNFTVLQTVKGEHIDNIPIRYFSETKSGQYRSVAGEVRFKEGTTYLLFLRKNNAGEWVTACLSYYLFEEQMVEDESMLVPIYRHGLLNVAEKEQEDEPLYVYHTDKLLSELKDVTSFKKDWDFRNAKAEKFDHIESIAHKAIPSHCNLFPVNPPPRWQNLDTQSLPIYYQSFGSGCSNIGDEMNDAVDYLTSNYKGVEMNIAGTFNNYSPTCPSSPGFPPNAAAGNFTSFVDSNLNGERSIAVIFDDPCNQLTNLNGCSGLLALGGLYYFTSTTHQYNGEIYSKSGYGYVIVNNGVGACNCGVYAGNNSETNYALMMTHELTHAIGFFHMDPSVTQANMAGVSCCSNSSINNLDVQCVDYVYNVAPIQGCTDDAAENFNASANISDGSCTYCSNGIQDGDETGVDCGGSGTGCAACIPDLIVQDCGTSIVSANNLNITGIQVVNVGEGNSSSATLAYYLSTNTTITTSDYLIGTDNIVALSPGGTSNESFSATLSNLNVPEGNYYIGMIADYNDLRDESNESNNSCYFSAPRLAMPTCSDGIQNGDETGIDCGGSCVSCLADLIVENCGTIRLTNSDIAGSGIVVQNVGENASTATRLGYYLSLDQTITENDYFLGSDYVNPLNSGATSIESFNFSVPEYPAIPLGVYYFGMIADYQKTLTEESENNNTCYQNTPRLVVSACGDGVMNGEETGVDCGGSHCPSCDCQQSVVTFRNDITSDVVSHARTSVKTQGDVAVRNSVTAHFIAQNDVLLSPGFEVTKGSVVVLATENCSN